MPVWSWSTTAANNATADSTIGWAEGMAPSAVNDSARAEMAAVAKWRNDISGANTTAGTSTAYTLTTSSVFDTLAHMDKALITCIINADNGASPTLAVDGLAAKAINRTNGVAIATGALKASTAYSFVYDNSNNQFLLLNSIGTELGALSVLASNGIIARTGSAAYSARTLTAPAAGITVSNGDGVSGNPTLALANDLSALEGISATGVIPYRSGADTWGTVTIGTGLSFSAGTLNTPTGTSAPVLLNTITISSGDASEIDSTSLTATYPLYEIVFENVVPVTDGVSLQLQVHKSGDGASTFQTTGYLSENWNATSGGASGVEATTTSVRLSGSNSVHNAAPGLSGSLRVSSPSANTIHQVWGQIVHTQAAGVSYMVTVGGYWNTAAVIDGFRILASSGNLTSGKIRVYGIPG